MMLRTITQRRIGQLFGLTLNKKDMFYKEEENSWIVGVEVSIPNVGRFTEENKEDIPLPWFWSDEPPKEYLDWINNQNEE